ncbi:MAG: helix-turn-helix transcriptional regulator [Lachnospiraceae bacterium]|nr:helix-turn-helix transcriptional regulator [Lachnospiraceae bacterium]
MEEQEQNKKSRGFTLQEIQSVIDYLEQNLMENITLTDVASFFYLNSSFLNQLFKMANGLTIMEYIRNRRLSESAKELKNTKIRIIDLALKYGYDTPEAFTKAFMRMYGFPPSFVRREDPPLKQFNPIKIQVKIDGGWSDDSNAVLLQASGKEQKTITPDGARKQIENLPKSIAFEQEKNPACDYNEIIKSKGGFHMEKETCRYQINLREKEQKEDWRILMLLCRKLRNAGIPFKVDGKTMIFAHGLEFKLEKICLTFRWKDEQEVRAFFEEKGKSDPSYPGFMYFDTMFEGLKIRCMFYGEYPDCDIEEGLYRNTDLVKVDEEVIRVQSLEFYYENAKPDAVYYKMVEDFIKKNADEK